MNAYFFSPLLFAYLCLCHFKGGENATFGLQIGIIWVGYSSLPFEHWTCQALGLLLYLLVFGFCNITTLMVGAEGLWWWTASCVVGFPPRSKLAHSVVLSGERPPITSQLISLFIWSTILAAALHHTRLGVFFNFIVVSLLGGVWLKNWFCMFMLLPVRF